MLANKYLTTFWITFPKDNFPTRSFGVTAYSIEDAYVLLREFGYDYHPIAKRIEIKKDITWDDLEENHVKPNIGPLAIRGIWYPHLNTR